MEEQTHFPMQPGNGGTVLQRDVSARRLHPTVHSPVEALKTLPERYNMDRLQLMVQSPFRVFAYWEVTSERLQRALAPFPSEEHYSFRMILRWIEQGQAQYQAYDSGAVSEWWFATRPGNRYRAELCLHSEEFGAVSVVGSNEVETPRDSVAEPAVEIEACRETTELLSKLVELTGLKKEVEQVEEPTQILEAGAPSGGQLHSEIKREPGPKASRVNTIRPTSFYW